jgi:hypothetical protein
LAQRGVGLFELDLVILDDLNPVSVWVSEVEPLARQDLGCDLLQAPSDRFLIVDDKAEVSFATVGVRLEQGDELVGQIDKRRPGLALGETDVEQLAPKRNRPLDIRDLEGDMIDADQAWPPILKPSEHATSLSSNPSSSSIEASVHRSRCRPPPEKHYPSDSYCGRVCFR